MGSGEEINYYNLDMSPYGSYDYHWVNILSMKDDEVSGETLLYVATWGDVKVIYLSDVLELSDESPNYLKAMLYYFT